MEASVEAAHPAICPRGAVAFAVEDGPHERLIVIAEVDRRLAIEDDRGRRVLYPESRCGEDREPSELGRTGSHIADESRRARRQVEAIQAGGAADRGHEPPVTDCHSI